MEINDPKTILEQGQCSVETYILRRPVMTRWVIKIKPQEQMDFLKNSIYGSGLSARRKTWYKVLTTRINTDNWT